MWLVAVWLVVVVVAWLVVVVWAGTGCCKAVWELAVRKSDLVQMSHS